jgi:hypothetical protein
MRKNKIYSWVISMALVFGVVLAGCDNGNSGSGGDGVPTTKGKLTITGLTSYNGKYAYAQTTSGTQVVCMKATSNASAEAVLISGSQVELPVYKFDGSNLASYSGSDTISLGIAICATKDMEGVPTASGTASVTFANGIGTATFSKTYGED